MVRGTNTFVYSPNRTDILECPTFVGAGHGGGASIANASGGHETAQSEIQHGCHSEMELRPKLRGKFD